MRTRERLIDILASVNDVTIGEETGVILRRAARALAEGHQGSALGVIPFLEDEAIEHRSPHIREICQQALNLLIEDHDG
jgi:hypothetical protein